MDILEKGKNAIGDDTLLLLQPMIAPIELRDYLFANGYDIFDEYVVREENKFYNIFCVGRGKAVVCDENRILGKNLAANSPDTIGAYLDYKIRVCDNIMNGIRKSDNPDSSLLDKYTCEKQIYEACKRSLII